MHSDIHTPVTSAFLDRLASYFDPPHQNQEPSSIQPLSDHQPLKRYTEPSIQSIQDLLQLLNAAWAKVPRTYIVLRLANEISILDPLISAGFTDFCFPLASPRDLPSFVKPASKHKIMAVQHAILTGAEELERGEMGCHISLEDGDTLPYEWRSRLGAGGYGQVDRVVSRISGKEYARKVMMRRAIFQTPEITMGRFVKEVEGLKTVRHRHMVQFVGSYTDANFLGLLMTPVADCNLAIFLELVGSSNERKMALAADHSLAGFLEKVGSGDEQKNLLQSFFGCLATGLSYLHERRINHKDIKPENILVFQENILFTDFGLVRDYSDVSNSISRGRTAFTRAYCAPEVAAEEVRRSSSDVWSLGCVFLEMVSALKGRTRGNLESFFEGHGSRSRFLYSNHEAYKQWNSVLRDLSNLDNEPLDWIDSMVHLEPRTRSTAQEIVDGIVVPGGDLHRHVQFCGICCRTSETILTSTVSGVQELASQVESKRIVTHRRLLLIEPKSILDLKRKRSKIHSEKALLLSSKKPRRSQDSLDTWNAAKRGDTKRVVRLLAQGASPNFVKDGTSTLHWAAKNGRLTMFKALIEKDADHDAKDLDGLSVLSYAVDGANIGIIRILLERGAKNDPDKLGAMSILLERYVANLDQPNNDDGTPLAWAAFRGNLDTVKLLTEHGASVDRRCTRWGRTPLSWAANNGHWTVVKYPIEERHADPESVALDTGRTPLSYASEGGHLQVVSVLLETKAVDTQRRDNDGKSALDYAEQATPAKREKIVSALQDFERGTELRTLSLQT